MIDKPAIIVTGKNGQLGSELQDIAGNYPQFSFYFYSSSELDISNAEQADSIFAQLQPAYFINCGAYTLVDKAETEKEKALAINGTGVGHIAALCNQYNTRLIHISTDYVFNGEGTSPYKEDEPTQPVNYYGFTKLQGENLALAANSQTAIIRTSWVYSTYGNNFVKTMIRLMKERPTLNVVSDQVGSPTYALDLAKAIMDIITTGFVAGIYHFSNDGITTWYDFAVAIKEGRQLPAVVNPIPSSAYPTPAKRPAYSAMSKDKIVATFHIALRPWQESLQECLAKL